MAKSKPGDHSPDTDDDLRLATMSAELADLRREVLMLRMANKELERVVIRDTMTPLYNRRHFLSCLNDRIGRLKRYDEPAVVLFLDLDGLKAVNDTHGHNAGDYLIMHTAQIIADQIRTTDVAARIGGDEFALILDSMTGYDAAVKLERLEEAMRTRPCDFEGIMLPVSASIGFTEITANDTDFAVIARADNAMYAAKRARQSARQA